MIASGTKRKIAGNGNDVPNVMDLRTVVRECAASFLTYTSAEELSDLVAECIETMDCLELIDDDVTWERVDTPTPGEQDHAAGTLARFQRFGVYDAA